METLTVAKPDNLQQAFVSTKEYIDAKCASVDCGECADIQSIIDNAVSVIKQHFIDNVCGGVQDNSSLAEELRKEVEELRAVDLSGLTTSIENLAKAIG